MFCSATTAAQGSDCNGVGVTQRTVSAPAIGKLQTVIGSVAITRADAIATQPAVGDSVHEGDLIETGVDGFVAIVFVDGRIFHLHASAHMVLDEFICGADKSHRLAVFRVAKGVFGFGAGNVATAGRLVIDTPLARIKNTVPAAGFGTVAFGIFTFGLIHELKAASADIALLDDGTIDYKDLKHGVFEIFTKEEHPRRIIVDDPGETIVLRPRGSSVSVEQVANTPTQMGQLQTAFDDAYSKYTQGLQDPFFQQFQQNHAFAQPQSTGTNGSSTAPTILASNHTDAPPSDPTNNNGGNPGGNTNGSSGAPIVTPTDFVIPPPPPPPPSALVPPLPPGPDYSPVGTPNPAVYSFVATGADVVAIFAGTTAGDTDILEMSVNGGPYIMSTLSNKGSVGATYNFGFVPAGAIVTFAIFNETTGQTLSSNAALNHDHDQHVWSYTYAQGAVALYFEDLLASGSDFNYYEGSDFNYYDWVGAVSGVTDPQNLGNLVVSDGMVLRFGGAVDNSGTIALNSTGDATELQIVGDGITLEGGGHVTLSDNDANAIVGIVSTTLTNVDNIISGVGRIGSGDGALTLVNEAHGTIDANLAGGTFTLETGAVITNNGTLEATNGGTLQVEDSVHGGNAIIEGGTLAFDAASSVDVTFNNGAGYGVLVLADPSQFTGDISGFAGTAPDATHSDEIDLVGINFNSGHFSDTYDSATGVLTVTDGSSADSLIFVGFSGNSSSFDFTADAAGTGTLITDPPAADADSSVVSSATANDVNGTITFADAYSSNTQTASFTPDGSNYVGSFSLNPATESNSSLSVGFELMTGNDHIILGSGETLTQSYNVSVADPQNPAENLNQTVSVSIGGPGNDNFVFQPGIGADTIVNFNPQSDTIELNGFSNIQSMQQLASLISNDAHGDAVIDLGHNDSITLPGMSPTELHAMLQSAVHLH